MAVNVAPLLSDLSYILRALETRSRDDGTSTRTGSFKLRRAWVVSLALSLAACQTAAKKIETIEVRVPVAVQPIKPAQVPAVPAPLGTRPASLSAAADLLLAKHCEFVAYALKADPLLRLSAGMQQQQLTTFPECEKH